MRLLRKIAWKLFSKMYVKTVADQAPAILGYPLVLEIELNGGMNRLKQAYLQGGAKGVDAEMNKIIEKVGENVKSSLSGILDLIKETKNESASETHPKVSRRGRKRVRNPRSSKKSSRKK